ncbi:MAG: hypothetical protein DYH12_20665 [Sorangiineae bacterium PRO1]|nr:hypothetical protein [Sorangiineae bacterium PRO1]
MIRPESPPVPVPVPPPPLAPVPPPPFAALPPPPSPPAEQCSATSDNAPPKKSREPSLSSAIPAMRWMVPPALLPRDC